MIACNYALSSIICINSCGMNTREIKMDKTYEMYHIMRIYNCYSKSNAEYSYINLLFQHFDWHFTVFFFPKIILPLLCDIFILFKVKLHGIYAHENENERNIERCNFLKTRTQKKKNSQDWALLLCVKYLRLTGFISPSSLKVHILCLPRGY
jgi:hypothetical protein